MPGPRRHRHVLRAEPLPQRPHLGLTGPVREIMDGHPLVAQERLHLRRRAAAHHLRGGGHQPDPGGGRRRPADGVGPPQRPARHGQGAGRNGHRLRSAQERASGHGLGRHRRAPAVGPPEGLREPAALRARARRRREPREGAVLPHRLRGLGRPGRRGLRRRAGRGALGHPGAAGAAHLAARRALERRRRSVLGAAFGAQPAGR
mmetsp:Transcript_130873/g.406960  ORF Transcript_130873/g.406960 Transcript_130873/m.406960 type:complete len:204 (-) Transcript_130873:99-710(-)